MIPPDKREEWIIRRARERPTAERAAFLDGACAGDEALRQRLEARLAAHDQLGRYKLLERTGEGGYGVVYVAKQTETVRRRVALKVIKLGMRRSLTSFGKTTNP